MLITEIITESIIAEERGGYLYHGMKGDKAWAVLTHDSMPAGWQTNIPGIGRVNGNSFTRNKLYGTEYHWGGYLVRLVIDQARLAQTHRMIPVNAELLHRLAQSNNVQRQLGIPIATIQDMPRDARDRSKRDPRERMDEEFVVGDIKNLHNYVVEIELFAGAPIEPPTARTILEYSKKYNIPVTGSARILDAVKKAAKKSKTTSVPQHPDPAEVAARWEKYHNNPLDPEQAKAHAEYMAQPEVAAREKAWAEKKAAMKAAGTY